MRYDYTIDYKTYLGTTEERIADLTQFNNGDIWNDVTDGKVYVFYNGAFHKLNRGFEVIR